jgi:multidrug efflux pump subunit AcrA (membrane-fusion protein)
LVTTPRLREKVGQYVREGDLICVVEEPAGLEVEITLAEQDVERVRPGQTVALRARALPLETLPARVDRIAPAAGHGDVQSTVAVYCRLDDSPPGLRPGMTGYGRVHTGPRPVGGVLLDRALRWLRTECWWL